MHTKFILHGGFTRINNELNVKFFSELVKDMPERGNILMCFFASGKEEKTDVFIELCEKLKQQTDTKEVYFTFATREEFVTQVQSADVIYFHGGSTRTLLSELGTYNDLTSLFQGKTVAGSSAGAYAIVTYGTAHDEECIRSGLGILPLRVVCHYQSEKLPPTKTSLLELENSAPELELVYLQDCESRVFYT